MVAAHAHTETVFTVLGDAARRRGSGSLAGQLVLSAAAATAILIAAPQWWSLAFLAGWSAAYSAWGLLVRFVEAREAHARPLHALLVTIAAVGTALAIAGMIGVGLAVYSGNARGVKDACGKGSTNRLCQAWANPTKTSGPIR
jgi:ABC-type phosphate transport system permease subunit